MTKEKQKQGLSTIAVQGGFDSKAHFGSTAVPIYQTAAYQFRDSDHAVALFNLEESGNIYTRISNPTVSILEERLALLEGGVGALVTSSGQSATFLAILNIAEAGDEIVSSNSLYGGTMTLFTHTLRKLGITVRFVDQTNLEQWKESLNEKTKAFFIESIGNPSLNVGDIEAIAQVAHEGGVPLMVDSTFTSPALLRPIEFGADIIIHSATKYIGGHGNTIAGVVVDGGKFPWDNGRFPGLSEPDPSYHGFCYTEAVGEKAYITKLKAQLNRDIGAALSPISAFLLVQGVETLPLRMKAHSENALGVAKYLESHPKVAWVRYPGLESHTTYDLAQKYLANGQSGILTFGIKGGYGAAKAFIDRVQLFKHVANLGDVRSLVIHPASTTHQQLTDDEKVACGVTNDLIRVSVGIEDLSDILADLEQALSTIE